MKKLFFFLLFLIFLLSFGSLFLWSNKASLLARFLQRNLEVPVEVGSLDLTRSSAKISNFSIGNPPGFTTPNALTIQNISFFSTLAQIRNNPLIIDEIEMDSIVITIEQTSDLKTNWDQILKSTKQPSKRHYLIKKLILNNLTVQQVSLDGKIKRYPTLEHLEFENISDETGFPISEIEKAIFNRVMQDLFQRFDLQKILQPLLPKGGLLPF